MENRSVLYLSLAASLAFLSACTGNKNILADKMSKFPAEQYITKVAAADLKEDAKTNALNDLKAMFNGLPQTEESLVRRNAVLSKAYTAQWWKDKPSKKYYAIAVLERAPAQSAVAPYYAPIDGKLTRLQQQINKEADKFVRLKYAVDMVPSFDERETLDEEYRLLSFDASPYDEDKLYSLKGTLNKTFYDIKINSKISGVDDITVKTYMIDSLNSIGFAVGEDLPSYDLELVIKTSADKYPSQTTDGLYWCTATANVSVKDVATGGVFATFSQSERIGAGRAEEAQRRSLISVGEKCAPLLKQKIIEYVQKK